MSGEPQPLKGFTVVVTRPASSTNDLDAALGAAGATVLRLPLTELTDPADGGAALDTALAHLSSYDWLVFTSANAVARVRSPKLASYSVRVAAVGSATADALRASGLEVDLMPPDFVGESLVMSFPEGPGKVLLPQSGAARSTVADGLAAKGWNVDVVEAYTSRPLRPNGPALQASLAADVITFASSLAVRSYVDVVDPARVSARVVCIGPVTAKTAREAGLEVELVAPAHTVDGMVRAIVAGRATSLGLAGNDPGRP